MEALDKWFWDQTSTPTGSVLLFLLIFLTRVGIDQYTQRRRTRKPRKPTKPA